MSSVSIVLLSGWLALVAGLLLSIGTPPSPSTGWLLAFLGTVPPVIVFSLSREQVTLSQRIAEVLHPADRPRTRTPAAGSGWTTS